MSDKADVLLKLNAIMKQKVEKDMAVVMLKMKQTKDLISTCQQEVEKTATRLFDMKKGNYTPSDIVAFEQWKRAQFRKITTLNNDLKPLEDVKVFLSTKLRTLTVRRNILLSQQAKRNMALALEKEALAEERNLEAWTHKADVSAF